jgi:DNA-binding transcriptional MerR regulator
MRSKNIADRAGVTIRTLRHYHRIGLLPEPPRDTNGYRRYGVQHLVRLLRIKRLAGLGLLLGELPALLDGADERRDAVLDELDGTLVRQIERSQEQRRIIAALRKGDGPIDMSPELAKAMLPLETRRAEQANQAGREQSVLLENTLTDEGRGALTQLYGRLAAPDLAEATEELGRRFDCLGPDSSEDEVAELAVAYVRHLGSWMREYNNVLIDHADSDANLLLWAHAMESVKPQQRRVISEIGLRLASGKRATEP